MTTLLDRLLGHLTTYRLVIVSLIVLVIVALGLGAAGELAFTPLELLGSLAVLLAATHAANVVAARIARVSPHYDSSTITALLLFFILPASLDPLTLAASAGAAAIAAVSKYLFAVRGRHIFNPAATGAFLAGIIGLVTPTWWVGTPPLLPLVAVAGALILFRTRHLPLGAVAVGVATAILLGRYLGAGLDLGTALGFALASSPLLFFVGFMLSEPLTLPPRRRQQLVVAALVAVILSVPFSTGALELGAVVLGPLSSTPELALVVGNAVSFALGQRRGIRLELMSKRQLTPTSWEFELRPLAPVRFTAGQFIEITLPHRGTDGRGNRRVFSIASASADRLKIGVRSTPPTSTFKQRLLALEPGERLGATSVGGDFVLPRDPAAPLLLVAGGIGITPFIGHLEHLSALGAANGVSPDVVVVYAVSDTTELAYLPELARSDARVVIASPEEPADLRPGWSWIGPDRLSAEAILAAVPDAPARTAYLSGPPSLVETLRRTLHRAGVRHPRTDVFVGY